MPEGVVVELMESSKELQLDAARKAARRALAALGERRAAGAIVFECACRKLLLAEGFDNTTSVVLAFPD